MNHPPATLLEIEQYFHRHMPLARAMAVRVERYDAEQLVLTAPLAQNHNHLGTAFGGSLSALATLAGYGMIWLALGEWDSHVVIRDSTISYRRPVCGDLRALCLPPDPAVLESFKTLFAARGKARIQLQVRFEDQGEPAVAFTGTYVALRGDSAGPQHDAPVA